MGMAAVLFNDAEPLELSIPFRQKALCEIWWILLKRFQRQQTPGHNAHQSSSGRASPLLQSLPFCIQNLHFVLSVLFFSI